MSDLFPRHILHMSPDDVVCGTPPIAFTFGLGGLLTFPLRYGASAVLLERHTPETLLQTIERFHATQCYTAPTFYRQMATLTSEFDLRSLRHPVSAGEALPDATRQLWKTATGIEITDGIGGTEVIHIYIASAGKQVRPGFIGQAIPGYVAQIVDEDMLSAAPHTRHLHLSQDTAGLTQPGFWPIFISILKLIETLEVRHEDRLHWRWSRRFVFRPPDESAAPAARRHRCRAESTL
jgi:acyl-coenzyme A synthetase/AMP-(fatty) acid ligase